MKTKIFNSLIEKVECDTGKDLETIGFRSKHSNYHLSFYGCADEDYNVLVEDFGCITDNDWKQLEPTKEQITIMQNTINNKVSELHNSEKESNIDEDFNGNYYDYYGVNQAMFI
jgi:hypothetical protein